MSRPVLARLLSDHRAGAGLSLYSLGKLLDVSTATLQRIEHGQIPEVATALRVCRWLGVSVEYAMGEREVASCSRCAVLARRIARAVKLLEESA